MNKFNVYKDGKKITTETKISNIKLGSNEGKTQICEYIMFKLWNKELRKNYEIRFEEKRVLENKIEVTVPKYMDTFPSWDFYPKNEFGLIHPAIYFNLFYSRQNSDSNHNNGYKLITKNNIIFGAMFNFYKVGSKKIRFTDILLMQKIDNFILSPEEKYILNEFTDAVGYTYSPIKKFEKLDLEKAISEIKSSKKLHTLSKKEEEKIQDDIFNLKNDIFGLKSLITKEINMFIKKFFEAETIKAKSGEVFSPFDFINSTTKFSTYDLEQKKIKEEIKKKQKKISDLRKKLVGIERIEKEDLNFVNKFIEIKNSYKNTFNIPDTKDIFSKINESKNNVLKLIHKETYLLIQKFVNNEKVKDSMEKMYRDNSHEFNGNSIETLLSIFERVAIAKLWVENERNKNPSFKLPIYLLDSPDDNLSKLKSMVDNEVVEKVTSFEILEKIITYASNYFHEIIYTTSK